MTEYLDETLKKKEETEKDKNVTTKPWWETLNPTIIIVAGIICVIIIWYMSQNKNGGGLWFAIAGIIVILVLLGAQPKPIKPVLQPWEAQIIALEELDRYERWGFFPQNTIKMITHIITDWSLDSVGQFYSIGITLILPYRPLRRYLEGRVQMSGDRRGFFTLRKSYHILDGTELKPEKRILGTFGNDMKKMGWLDKIFPRGGA